MIHHSLRCAVIALLLVPMLVLVSANSSIAETPTGLHIETGLEDSHVIHLRGRDARHQLLVTMANVAGVSVDATRLATYTVQPAGVVAITASGYVTPVGPGETTITATLGDAGASAHLSVVVEAFDDNQPVNFPNQVVPVFTKLSCNGGGCHGKAAGQNGFKLSLLGFHPKDDYEFLVRESRGRRLFNGATPGVRWKVPHPVTTPTPAGRWSIAGERRI